MSEKDNLDFEKVSADNNEDIEAAFSSLIDDIKKSTNRSESNSDLNSDGLDDFFKDMKIIYEDDSMDNSDPGISRYLESEDTKNDSLNQNEELEENSFSSENIEYNEYETNESSNDKIKSDYYDDNSYLDLYKEISNDTKKNEDLENKDISYNSDELFILEIEEPVQEVSEKTSLAQSDAETDSTATIEKPLKSNKIIVPKKATQKEAKIKKPLTTGQLLYKIAMIVFIFIAVCCALYLAYKFIFSAIITNYLSSSLSDKRITETNEDDLNKKFLELQAKYPDVVFPEGIIPSLWVPYAENQNTIGWLTIEGLGIDYPVVQTDDNDNVNFYLRRDFYTKKYSTGGTLFLSSSANIKPFNKNLVIYGHRMDNGTMFGKLKKYKSIDNYIASPIIKFDTLYEENYWKIYAIFLTNALETDDNGYAFNYTVANFASDEKFVSFINELDQRKLYSTGVDINKNDTLLTLSTCDYDFNEARLVVVARKVRANESIEVDTALAKAKKESDIKYPQAWYDKKGKTNPFKGVSGWTP